MKKHIEHWLSSAGGVAPRRMFQNTSQHTETAVLWLTAPTLGKADEMGTFGKREEKGTTGSAVAGVCRIEKDPSLLTAVDTALWAYQFPSWFVDI